MNKMIEQAILSTYKALKDEYKVAEKTQIHVINMQIGLTQTSTIPILVNIYLHLLCVLSPALPLPLFHPFPSCPFLIPQLSSFPYTFLSLPSLLTLSLSINLFILSLVFPFNSSIYIIVFLPLSFYSYHPLLGIPLFTIIITQSLQPHPPLSLPISTPFSPNPSSVPQQPRREFQ